MSLLPKIWNDTYLERSIWMHKTIVNVSDVVLNGFCDQIITKYYFRFDIFVVI